MGRSCARIDSISREANIPHLAVSGEDNCSYLTTDLIVADLYLSDLAVAVTEMDITFVYLYLSPTLFYFSAIIFGPESNLDFVALDNLIHSYI